MQCAKHNVGYVLISRIFIQMCTYMTTDVRNFNGKLLLPVLPEERL